MDKKDQKPSGGKHVKLTYGLDEITNLQLSIKDLTRDLVQLVADNEEAVIKLCTVASLASQAGCLADICRNAAGREPFYPNSDHWLLPPMAQDDKK